MTDSNVKPGDTVRYTGHLGEPSKALVTDVGEEKGELYVLVEYDGGEGDIWYWDQFEVVKE